MSSVTRALIEEVLAQHALLCRSAVDPALAALGTAILLEDSLGLTLSDADLDPSVLGDPAAVRALVGRLTGGC